MWGAEGLMSVLFCPMSRVLARLVSRETLHASSSTRICTWRTASLLIVLAHCLVYVFVHFALFPQEHNSSSRAHKAMPN